MVKLLKWESSIKVSIFKAICIAVSLAPYCRHLVHCRKDILDLNLPDIGFRPFEVILSSNCINLIASTIASIVCSKYVNFGIVGF